MARDSMTLDEVIQFTKQALEKVNPDKRVYTEFRFTYVQVNKLLEWLEDYKHIKSNTSRLIPCSEMMPEKDDAYLCVSNGEFKILQYRNGEFYNTCFDAVLRCCNSSVTHWMPLPEPPEAYEYGGDYAEWNSQD